MRRVLIVSPHFPPVNAADMHRVRIALPFFEEFGWCPHVLTVDPDAQHLGQDPALVETVPGDIPVTRVRALSTKAMRRIGVRNVALRALPFMHSAGKRLLGTDRYDLVYVSTTMFAAMPLARLWKRRFGVPYVLDIQDPWLSTYYEDNRAVPRPPKYRLAHALDAVMEPWTMRRVDGLIAVSDDYVATLRARYPWIDAEWCVTLPFGASRRDFEVLDRVSVENRVFRPGDGCIHGVYVGRGGDDMAPALRLLFEALKAGLCSAPDLFQRVRLHFVGTDYASADRARRTVSPIAAQCGVADHVIEQTDRVSYFETLRLLKDADFLVVIGSDDPQYTASKIYPYVLARRPIVAVLHENSSAARILRELRAGVVATFGDATAANDCAVSLQRAWADVLGQLPCTPDVDWKRFEPYTAREMTRRQCTLFDEVIARQPSH